MDSNELHQHFYLSYFRRGLFCDGQDILVAVSGGVDSMVLLDLLHQHSKRQRWNLTVAHFNHQLRGTASDNDEKLVREIAGQLKLPFQAGRANIRKAAQKSGTSIEMAARTLRHDFLAATATKLKIPTVALAHHQDDQVEVFFLRLLRGAGGEGLSGMKWTSPSPSSPKIQLVRPLLDVPKSDLEQFARANNISFYEDISNSSLDIQRNRLRHEVIPLLTAHFQPALAKTVLRLMDVVGTEADFAGSVARKWLAGPRTPDFASLPAAVQRRVIQYQLIDNKFEPDFELIERLRLQEGAWNPVSPDWTIYRDAQGSIQRVVNELFRFNPEARTVTFLGAKGAAAFGELKISWETADDSRMDFAGKPANVEYYDADRVGTRIWLRYWQAGDRFQPIGTKSARKLQDLFTNAKVPAAERRRRVIAATSQGEVFWVEGLRMAEKFKLDKNTVRKLKWCWHRNPGFPSS